MFSVIVPSSLQTHSFLPSAVLEHSQSQIVLKSEPIMLDKKVKEETVQIP